MIYQSNNKCVLKYKSRIIDWLIILDYFEFTYINRFDIFADEKRKKMWILYWIILKRLLHYRMIETYTVYYIEIIM